MDVVMEETVVPRALSAQESTSLVDLTLSPAEVQMNNWKPIVQNIMQQFADYDNESYDIKTCLYGISFRTTIGTLKKNCYHQSKLISARRNIAT